MKSDMSITVIYHAMRLNRPKDISVSVIYHNMSLTVLYQESIEKNTLTITFRLC